jgi:hypothetical protein
MAQASITIPGAAIRSRAIGVLFMAIFGTLWAVIGAVSLQGAGNILLWVCTSIIFVLLLGGSIYLFRISNTLPRQMSAENNADWKKRRRWFRVIFATEGVAMGIATAICNATNHLDFLFPIIALIVGLHFFPLAPVFRMPSHYVTGALICLLALITMLVLPARITIASQQIILWWVVTGLGEALVLWGTGLLLFIIGMGLLRGGVPGEYAAAYGSSREG